MHELMLLRHAEALPSGHTDLDRPLSTLGIHQAKAVGQWLAKHNHIPHRVLCSPALRTATTAKLALSFLGQPTFESVQAIYEATPNELLALLNQHQDANRVLLIGHNPGIEQLVTLLLENPSSQFHGMPPAGLAILGISSSLKPKCAHFDAFWTP